MKNKLEIIRFMFFLGILCFTFTSTSQMVKAGDLSLPEADLIEFIHGTFEHNGSTYKIKSEYISQAEAYMMRDDINLTSEDKSQAISMFYENIQQGIDEGYMELISSDSKREQDIETGNQQETSSQAGSQNSDYDSTKDSGVEKNISNGELENKGESTENEQTPVSEGSEAAEDFFGLGLGLTGKTENESGVKNENSNQTENAGLPGENNQEIDGVETESDDETDSDNYSEQVPEPSSTENAKEDSRDNAIKDPDMIKKTGFSSMPIKTMGIACVVCYLIVVVITIQNKFAANKNGTH